MSWRQNVICENLIYYLPAAQCQICLWMVVQALNFLEFQSSVPITCCVVLAFRVLTLVLTSSELCISLYVYFQIVYVNFVYCKLYLLFIASAVQPMPTTVQINCSRIHRSRFLKNTRTAVTTARHAITRCGPQHYCSHCI